MPVIPYKEFNPEVHRDVFVAPNGWVIGKCVLGRQSSVFFGAVLRGDINKILVGDRSNIQDNAVLHTSRGLGDCVVGADVTVGHGAILHGCTVRDRCIIGMGATILDDAIIGEDCIIGANSLITMRTQIPPGSMVMGSPAKVVRALKPDEYRFILESAKSYVGKAHDFLTYFSTRPE